MARVLSVGQCAYDHGQIHRQLRTQLGVEVDGVDTFDEALEATAARAYRLVLVNRISDVDGSSGLDLIRMLKADPERAGIPVMLVSNYPDAQRQAESLGALPGFGKGDLRSSQTLIRIRAALSETSGG